MIKVIDGYVDVTREFDCVPVGYVVLYNDSSMDYKVFNTRDEFFEFYSQDENEVQFYFDDLNTQDDFEIDDSDFDDLTIQDLEVDDSFKIYFM